MGQGLTWGKGSGGAESLAPCLVCAASRLPFCSPPVPPPFLPPDNLSSTLPKQPVKTSFDMAP